MIGKTYIEKYLDPGSLIVKIHINKITIPNTLIGLGVAINVIIDEIQLNNICYTPIVL